MRSEFYAAEMYYNGSTNSFRRILQLLSSRWLEQLKAKWWPRPQYEAGGNHCANHPGNFDGIGMDNIAGFFVMMLAGILVATVALIGEWIFLRRMSITRRLGAGVETRVEAERTEPTQAINLPPKRRTMSRRRRSVWSETIAEEPKNEGGAGDDVGQALADIVSYRQRRRRLSRSVCLDEDDEADVDRICSVEDVTPTRF